MINQAVLDASAVLAYLQDESGCEKVHEALSEGKAIISSVNYAEVVGKLQDAGLPDASVQTVMGNLDLHIEPLSTQHAWLTGLMRASTKELGLSLGDRACLALASILQLPVITADKQWEKLLTEVTIIQLR
jgi:PIN domain nuclease of toxin-antitoxin system